MHRVSSVKVKRDIYNEITGKSLGKMRNNYGHILD